VPLALFPLKIICASLRVVKILQTFRGSAGASDENIKKKGRGAGETNDHNPKLKATP
jgi:hypothetical protein